MGGVRRTLGGGRYARLCVRGDQLRDLCWLSQHPTDVVHVPEESQQQVHREAEEHAGYSKTSCLKVLSYCKDWDFSRKVDLYNILLFFFHVMINSQVTPYSCENKPHFPSSCALPFSFPLQCSSDKWFLVRHQSAWLRSQSSESSDFAGSRQLSPTPL